MRDGCAPLDSEQRMVKPSLRVFVELKRPPILLVWDRWIWPNLLMLCQECQGTDLSGYLRLGWLLSFQQNCKGLSSVWRIRNFIDYLVLELILTLSKTGSYVERPSTFCYLKFFKTTTPIPNFWTSTVLLYTLCGFEMPRMPFPFKVVKIFFT
jgi:hypothetical protein